jgi:hypothetical protein
MSGHVEVEPRQPWSPPGEGDGRVVGREAVRGESPVAAEVVRGGTALPVAEGGIGYQQVTRPVEVEPERAPPTDGAVMAGPGVPLRPTRKVSMVFEPASSATKTRASLLNWICFGASALAPSGWSEPGIGRSPW